VDRFSSRACAFNAEIYAADSHVIARSLRPMRVKSRDYVSYETDRERERERGGRGGGGVRTGGRSLSIDLFMGATSV